MWPIAGDSVTRVEQRAHVAERFLGEHLVIARLHVRRLEVGVLHAGHHEDLRQRPGDALAQLVGPLQRVVEQARAQLEQRQLVARAGVDRGAAWRAELAAGRLVERHVPEVGVGIAGRRLRELLLHPGGGAHLRHAVDLRADRAERRLVEQAERVAARGDARRRQRQRVPRDAFVHEHRVRAGNVVALGVRGGVEVRLRARVVEAMHRRAVDRVGVYAWKRTPSSANCGYVASTRVRSVASAV